MNGKIVKAVSGYYYVKTEAGNIYECRARGALKNENITPLVGDNAVFNVTDADARTGIVNEIGPRTKVLTRPSVANVDQAVVVFAVRDPNPNLSILDRFIALMKKQDIPTVIVFNKCDLAKGDDIKNLKKTYKDSGCRVIFTTLSGDRKKNVMQLRFALKGKISVLTGPSGSGKSTLINLLAGVKDENDQPAQVGAISSRIGRGRQTTRHNELFTLGSGSGYSLIDTPGFSSLMVSPEDYTRDTLQQAFPEFAPYSAKCPFSDCKHVKERDCAVRSAVEDGKISSSRYNSYKAILSELKSQEKY